MKKRWIAALCALLLVCGMVAVMPSAAAQKENLYFTAVNDTILDLQDETMPRMINNILYVPYTVFDPYSVNGVKLGVYSSYNRAKSTLMLYARSKVLIFDLDKETATFDNKPVSGKVIIRNSMALVPLELICELFGLEWSWIVMERGYVIRVKSEDVVLSDRDFATAATYAVEMRYQKYMQNKVPETSGQPTTSTPPATESPKPTSPVTPGGVLDAEDAWVYLGFRMTDGEGFADILKRMKDAGVYGVFFCLPSELALRDDDIRALLAAGHRIGLVLDGETAQDQLEQFREGNRLLRKIAYTETAVAVSENLTRGERKTLEESCILWKTTLEATAEGQTQTGQISLLVNGVDPGDRCFAMLDDSRQSFYALSPILTRLTDEGAEFHLASEVTLQNR